MGKKRDVFEDVAKRQSAHAMNRVKVCHEFGGGSSLSLKTNRSVFLRLPLEQPRHWRRLLTVSSIKSSCSFFFSSWFGCNAMSPFHHRRHHCEQLPCCRRRGSPWRPSLISWAFCAATCTTSSPWYTLSWEPNAAWELRRG